jgi:hypothetical protein
MGFWPAKTAARRGQRRQAQVSLTVRLLCSATRSALRLRPCARSARFLGCHRVTSSVSDHTASSLTLFRSQQAHFATASCAAIPSLRWPNHPDRAAIAAPHGTLECCHDAVRSATGKSVWMSACCACRVFTFGALVLRHRWLQAHSRGCGWRSPLSFWLHCCPSACCFRVARPQGRLAAHSLAPSRQAGACPLSRASARLEAETWPLVGLRAVSGALGHGFGRMCLRGHSCRICPLPFRSFRHSHRVVTFGTLVLRRRWLQAHRRGCDWHPPLSVWLHRCPSACCFRVAPPQSCTVARSLALSRQARACPLNRASVRLAAGTLALVCLKDVPGARGRGYGRMGFRGQDRRDYRIYSCTARDCRPALRSSKLSSALQVIPPSLSRYG